MANQLSDSKQRSESERWARRLYERRNRDGMSPSWNSIAQTHKEGWIEMATLMIELAVEEAQSGVSDRLTSPSQETSEAKVGTVLKEEQWDATACCGYQGRLVLPHPVFWNPYNRVVQCHNCGHVYVPQNLSALSSQLSASPK